jgi:hypothetical protein
MSMHLLPAPSSAIKLVDRALSLMTSYENGSVKLWRYRNIEKERSIEGVGWDCIWSLKLHVESGKRSSPSTFIPICRLMLSRKTVAIVMATSVSLDRSIALSVSADHLVGRYELNVCKLSPLFLLPRITLGENRVQINTPLGGSYFKLQVRGDGVPNEAPGEWRRRVPRRGAGVCRGRLGRSVRAPIGVNLALSFLLKAKKKTLLLYPKRNGETNKMNAGCYSVRLFSTKSFKALGTLIYHKAAVQALAFARACPVTALRHHDQHHSRHSAKISARGDGDGGDCGDASGTRSLAADTPDASRSGDHDDNDSDRDDHDDDDGHRDCDDDDDNDITVRNNDAEEEGEGEGDNDEEDDEMSAEEKARRSRWLVSGAKDGRVVIWALMDFRGEGRQKERAQ